MTYLGRIEHITADTSKEESSDSDLLFVNMEATRAKT